MNLMEHEVMAAPIGAEAAGDKPIRLVNYEDIKKCIDYALKFGYSLQDFREEVDTWEDLPLITLPQGIDIDKASEEEKRDNNDRGGTAVTWGDLYGQFKKEYPKADVIDFRPFVEGYLPRNRPGIIVWLKNGDVLVYIPKAQREKREATE